METPTDSLNIRYYCLKVKADNKNNSFFALLLLFFEVIKNPRGSYELVFSGSPHLMITWYPKKKAKNLNTSDSWQLFEEAINEHIKEKIENVKKQDLQYISLYNNIYNKTSESFYKEKTKYTNQKNIKIEKIFGDLEIKIINIFTFAQNRVEVNLEEISSRDFEKKSQNISDDHAETSQSDPVSDEKNKGRPPINWFMDKEVEIKNYLPIISVKDGIVSRKLGIGDQIMVSLEGRQEGQHTSLLSQPSIEEASPALIIDQVTTNNRCRRFLVLLESEEYGDVEVYDDLIKVKTVDTQNKNPIETSEESEFLLSWQLFLNLFLIALFIFVVYILVTFL